MKTETQRFLTENFEDITSLTAIGILGIFEQEHLDKIAIWFLNDGSIIFINNTGVEIF